MDKIKEGQTLHIELDLEDDLSWATSAEIRYLKPNGVVGRWAAVINGTSVSCDIPKGILTPVGTWKIYAFSTDGTMEAFGETVPMAVHNEFAL